QQRNHQQQQSSIGSSSSSIWPTSSLANGTSSSSSTSATNPSLLGSNSAVIGAGSNLSSNPPISSSATSNLNNNASGGGAGAGAGAGSASHHPHQQHHHLPPPNSSSANASNGPTSRFGSSTAGSGGPFGSASSPFAPGPFGPPPPLPPHHQHHPGQSHGGPQHHPSSLSHNHSHPHVSNHGHGHGHGSFGNVALSALGLGGSSANGPGSGGGSGANGSGSLGHNQSGPSLGSLGGVSGSGISGGSGGGLGSAASSAFNPSGSSSNLLGGSNGPTGIGSGLGGGQQANTGPMPAHWQNQLLKAEISRQSSAPHHHARAAALAARSATSSAIAIQDPSAKAASSPAAGVASGAAPIANGLFVSKRDAPISGGGAPPTNTSPNGSSETASPTGDSAGANAAKEVNGADSGPAQTWTTIDMGGLALKNLASDLFKYTFLTSLFVNHNALTTLSPAIVNLRNLTVLDASGNKLTSIPAELGMLTNLRELFLFDNALSTLPPELGTLHQLEMLGIEGNPLSDKLRNLIQREGTLALIAYLRDSCPVPLPPPEREWITIETDIIAPGTTGPSWQTKAAALTGDAEKKQRQRKGKGDGENGNEKDGGDEATAEGAHADKNSDEEDEDAPEPPPETFNLLTYNILCDRYATQQMYGYTPSWALAWDYRKELILQEVMSYSADFCCLQEVDIEQYEDYFLHHLSQQDYEGVFWPKSRARTMRDDERRHVDGCAIFYKSNKWTLIEKRLIEFNQLALQRPDFKKTQDMFNRVMTKDQIAVIALLENKASGARLIVTNVHIYWDPEFRDVKLVQVAMLTEELEKIAGNFAKLPPKLSSMLAEPYRKRGPPAYRDGTCIPTIICGDFNSVPDTGVYQFLRQGSVAGNHEDFMSHVYGRYTSSGLEHKLSLRSAYEGIGELPFTNYTPNYKGVIDYVWYNTNALAVSGLLGDVDPAYRDKVVGFPNAHFPSDHVCLLAEFTVRPNSTSTAISGPGGGSGPADRKRIAHGGNSGGGNADEERTGSKSASSGPATPAAETSSSSLNAGSASTTSNTNSSSGGGFGFGFGGLGSKLAAATNRRTFNPDFSTFGRTGSR
ncbi:Glucose-repressible alcohol dehydrogenase transcriptional effector, partial [Tilletia horrida]